MSKGKRKTKKQQKLYKMKGCFNINKNKKKTRKNKYFGGDGDVNLAYTGKDVVPMMKNPFLAYTGTNNNVKIGGTSSTSSTNDITKAFPNEGPANVGKPATPFLNPLNSQNGGTCGCGLMKGGTCGNGCGLMSGGSSGGKKQNHRTGCKCSLCKKKMTGGNPGIPYPNGLVGSPWSPSIKGWPGVDSISGNRNYLEPNNYKTDIQTAMISTGSQPPFSVGGGKKKKQKGGTLSNFMGQDLINLGRQFQFGVGSAYNAINGYAAPVNPLPWKGQLTNTPTTMR